MHLRAGAPILTRTQPPGGACLGAGLAIGRVLKSGLRGTMMSACLAQSGPRSLAAPFVCGEGCLVMDPTGRDGLPADRRASA